MILLDTSLSDNCGRVCNLRLLGDALCEKDESDYKICRLCGEQFPAEAQLVVMDRNIAHPVCEKCTKFYGL